MKTSHLIGTLDPNEEFMDVDKSRLVEAMGVLPSWVVSSFEHGCRDIPAMKEELARNYGFGELYPMQGEIDEIGTYLYPEDPPMHPLASMSCDNITVYFWKHAMLGIVDFDTEEKFVTRMD